VAGNLPGEPDAPPTRHISQSSTVTAPVAGFWICDVRAGNEVRSGQPIGRILGLLGDILTTIEAPQDGFVIYRTTSAAVKPDGLLVNIGA
jgi:predicted deacylase